MFVPNPRKDLTDHFGALASPTRLRILERLAEAGEMGVNDLAAHLRMSQPRVSWHLRMLRLGHVVITRREGRQVYCSLDMESIKVHQRELFELLSGEETRGDTPTMRKEVTG